MMIMDKEGEDANRLTKWLAGELTGEALTSFLNSPEYKDYEKILESTSNLPLPEMDAEKAFVNIQSRLSSKPKKTKYYTLKRTIIAVAAISVLMFAVRTVFPGSLVEESKFGQQVVHSLPDGSHLILNGNSKLEYQKDFVKDRNLHLDGEAFFEVEKGSPFVVHTNLGKVTVLGTSFNVFNRDDIFSIACKTGKVRVESGSNTFDLLPGSQVRIRNGKTEGIQAIETEKISNWKDGETYFSGATLEEVALSLSSIYDKNIRLSEEQNKRVFTGSFVHNDIEKALKMVFSPMNINYTINNSEIITSSK